MKIFAAGAAGGPRGVRWYYGQLRVPNLISSLRNIIGVPSLLAPMITAAVIAVLIRRRVAAPAPARRMKQPAPGA